MVFINFAEGIDFSTDLITEQAFSFISNPTILIIGIILIAATIFIIFFLKKIIANTVIGLIVWAILTFILHIELPFIPSFVVAVVFGPAGIGVLLLLKFLGLM
jgi:hypothetical protein